MSELDVRAGETLEQALDRYARMRLDPSPAQARRARSAVMEAAWRQRLVGSPVGHDADSMDVSAAVMTVIPSPRRHPGLFAGWSPRRLGLSVAAAVLAGLMVGTSAFAGSRPGGPLYAARVAFEGASLPSDRSARLEAEMGLAQGRLADIVEAAARDDPRAVDAAVQAYIAMIDELSDAMGGPADRAFLAVQFHRSVLLDVLGRVPAEARAGIEQALAESSRVMDRLDRAGTTPTTGGAGSGTGSGAGSGSGTGGGTGNGGAGAGGGAGGNGGGGRPTRSEEPATATASEKPAKSSDPVASEKPARSSEPAPSTPAPEASADDGGQQGGTGDEDLDSNGGRPSR